MNNLVDSCVEMAAMLFSNPPLPPFSMFADFSEATPDQVTQFYSQIVMYGAKAMYDKGLHELSPSQIETLREYLLSMGCDVEYNLNEDKKIVLEYTEEGERVSRSIKTNHYQLVFKPADPALNKIEAHISPN
jgi:hypothetical protein